MPSTTINRGNVLSTVVMNVTITPVSVAATTAVEQTFIVPGLQVGDQVSGLTYVGAWTSLVSFDNFRVTAANTLGISFTNGTAGPLTPLGGQFLVEINRPETTLPTNAA
jgi:hypothetical protein